MAAVRRVAAARAVSLLGSQVAAVALAYSVYMSTSSGLLLAATFLAVFGVPALLMPVAGYLADLVDRRLLMIGSDAAAACCWLGVGVLPWTGARITLATVAAVLQLPSSVCAQALLPGLVPSGQLARATAAVGSATNAARLFGPVLGGAVVATAGAGAAYAGNAASFALSAALLVSLRVRSRAVREESADGVWAGVRVIARDPLLRPLVVIWMLGFVCLEIAVVVDVPLVRALGHGSVGYGLVDTCFGVGLLLGSVAAGRLVREGREWRWVLTGTAGVGAAWLAVGLFPGFPLLLGANVVAAAMDAVFGVAGYQLFQSRTADATRGRVLAAANGAGMLANLVGYAAGGLLLEIGRARDGYLLGGLLAGAAFGLAAFALVRSGRPRHSGRSAAPGDRTPAPLPDKRLENA
jgi:MFS family permease